MATERRNLRGSSLKCVTFKSIYFEVTRFCNQRCRHCYLDAGLGEDIQGIGLKDFRRIIDNFKKQGGESLVVTGGEAFTLKDIFLYLDYLETKKIFFGVASNGLLLDEAKIERLSRYRYLEYLFTSLLGSTAEEHNSMALNKSFNKVLKNLALFDKYGLDSCVQVTLKHGYLQSMQRIMELLSNYNCTVKFTPVTCVGRKRKRIGGNDLIATKEECSLFMDELAKIQRKYPDRITKPNLRSFEDVQYFINLFKDKPLYTLNELILNPRGEKYLTYTPVEQWGFGFAQEKVEIDIDERLMRYVELLRQIDQKLLGKARREKYISLEYERALMLRRYQH